MALHTTLQRRGISLLGGILSYTGCRRLSWVDLDASLPMYINTPDTTSPHLRFLHECGWGPLRDEPGAVRVYSTSRDCEALHTTCARPVLWCSDSMNIATLHASVKLTALRPLYHVQLSRKERKIAGRIMILDWTLHRLYASRNPTTVCYPMHLILVVLTRDVG